MTVETRDKLYEGKAKIVYETNQPGRIIQYFKDDATAFNALKKGTIVGKGVINNRMSAALFEVLERPGCQRTTSRPCRTARCSAAGSTSSRSRRSCGTSSPAASPSAPGLEEGTPIKQPIVELYYKSDPLGDPMLNDDHVRMMQLATPGRARLDEAAWRSGSTTC